MNSKTNEHWIDQLLILTDRYRASDLIIRSNDRIRLRIDGKVKSLPTNKVPPPNREQVIEMIQHLSRTLLHQPDIDHLTSFDFHYRLENIANFRIHLMSVGQNPGIVIRHIPKQIPSFQELRLPPVINEICDYRSGLILVAGATGSGKSTSLASMLNYIIDHRPVHIVTLEDPIEFAYSNEKQGTVTQRQVGVDVLNYAQGLIDALREAPDVILLGEMRQKSEIQLALNAAETGHLVAATVHATSAVGTIQRMMGAFPLDEQSNLLDRTAESLRAIIVQKLLPKKDGPGRVPTFEILLRTPVIKQFLLDWKNRSNEIPRVLEEGHPIYGSQTFDQHLKTMVDADLVHFEDARHASIFPEDFDLRMGKN